MLSRLRPRITYANAMATIAVFVALGGGAYAASQINGSQLRDRSVAGRKLRHDTLGGYEIRESALGKVARAASADAVRGASLAGRQRYATPTSGDTTVLSLSRFVRVIGKCAGGQATLRVENAIPAEAAANNITAVMTEDGAKAAWAQLGPGQSQESAGAPRTPGAKTIEWTLHVVNGRPSAVVEASVLRYADNDSCEFNALAVRY